MATATAQSVRDSLAEVFARAPVGEPFPPEILAEIQQAAADIEAGRGVLHDDVPAWLEGHARVERAR